MGTVRPTPECNPKPLKCHGANCGVARFAAIELCLVIFVCPATFLQRVERPFMEGSDERTWGMPIERGPAFVGRLSPVRERCRYSTAAPTRLSTDRVESRRQRSAEGPGRLRRRGRSGTGRNQGVSLLNHQSSCRKLPLHSSSRAAGEPDT